MKKRCLAILAVWLMLLSAACDQLDPMAMPGLEGDCPSAGIDWFYCGDTFECGHLRVLADYRDPARGSLRFPLIVHRAPSPEERRGYQFVNPGGPGVSGIAYLEQALPELPGELVEHFDLVGFDPRGVGYAEPAFARVAPGDLYTRLAAIEPPLDTAAKIAAGQAAAYLCVESMGPMGVGCTRNTWPGTWTRSASSWAPTRSPTWTFPTAR